MRIKNCSLSWYVTHVFQYEMYHMYDPKVTLHHLIRLVQTGRSDL